MNFHKLNAVKNEVVEDQGVTVLYYEGKFLDKYPIMAFTLYEESLHSRTKLYKYFLSENILRMSYQLVRKIF